MTIGETILADDGRGEPPTVVGRTIGGTLPEDARAELLTNVRRVPGELELTEDRRGEEIAIGDAVEREDNSVWASDDEDLVGDEALKVIPEVTEMKVAGVPFKLMALVELATLSAPLQIDVPVTIAFPFQLDVLVALATQETPGTDEFLATEVEFA